MMKRTRLVVATAAAIALAATSAASAAAPGPSPAPGAGKPGTVTTGADGKSKVDGKARAEGSSKTAGTDFAAAAASLGVTVGQLEQALTSAKTSLASLPSPTEDDLITAVATTLGLPVARVRDALQPMIGTPGPGGPATKEGDDPQNSPFLSDAAAASLATALGVDQARAKAALAAVVALAAASDGIDVGSPVFGEIAASLGVSSDQLRSALAELKQSLHS
jgi:predicted trehalose synthase